MKKRFSFILLFYVPFFVYAQHIDTTWSGIITIQQTKLRVIFHIKKAAEGYTSKLDSPDQGKFGLPATQTVFTHDSLEITSAPLKMTYRGKLQGDSIVGMFTQSTFSTSLILKKSKKETNNRPQEPKPPYPYRVEEVTFLNDSLTLAGTLTFPDSDGTFPAVILIAGSGAHDRDETVFGHKPFLVLADYLTRQGFAVLRYDKRGVGQSTGDYAKATTHDFAADAQAAFEYLLTHENIDKQNIFLIGHSEGGVIAPMVAASNPNVAGVVLMAAMGVSGEALLLKQNEVQMLSQDMELETMRTLQAMNTETMDFLKNTDIYSENSRSELKDRLNKFWEELPILTQMQMKKEAFVQANERAISSRWYRAFLHLNPAKYLQKVACPVFALNGEKDVQVDAADNLYAIKIALEKADNRHVILKVYPELNHLFQHCQTGQTSEYGKIDETIAPKVLTNIAEWIKLAIK